MKIQDSVCVVTGGASGLGEGVVNAAVQRGARVVILDLPSGKGASLAAELGEKARFVALDVTKPEQVESAVAEAAAAWGRIDALVSCAGISSGERMLTRGGDLHTLEHFRSHIEVNLIGLFDVLRHVVVAMSANEPATEGERGVIVNLGSIAGIEGQAGQMSYSASKGGVIGLTLPLARDLGSRGIRVVTICPGIMDTPILSSLTSEQIEGIVEGNVFPKRLGSPADLAELVFHVMTNTYLNGAVIRLDAGMRLNTF